MKNARRLLPALALLLVPSVFWATTGGATSLLERFQATLSTEKGPTSILASTFDREGTRSVLIIHPSGPAIIDGYEFDETSEIDVTTLVIQVGTGGPPNTREGIILLIRETVSSFGGTIVSLPADGTDSITFNPPLKIRSGDVLGFGEITGSGDAQVTLQLYGTPPSGATGLVLR